MKPGGAPSAIFATPSATRRPATSQADAVEHKADHPDYLLIGGADISCATTACNVALANDLAAALRRAGFTSAMLVLDAEESLALDHADSNAT